MQAKQQNDLSVSIPLLVDYESSKHQLCDVEKAKEIEPFSLNFTGTSSFLKTTFNGLNSLSGVGILSIPYALSSGGWLSLILLFIIATLTFYTGLLIKTCMETDPEIRSYPDIGDKAFGKKGRIIVSIFTNLELYLVATGFLILVGDNLHNLLPNVEISICGIVIGGRQSFVLLVAFVMMPTVWINNITTLSYVSASGVLASVILVGAVLWCGMNDGIGFNQKGVLVNWKGLPTSFSLYAFCYCAHPVFPTLYTSMRNQRRFSWLLLVCFLLSTITYVTMAILGYLRFGSELQSQITLNLPPNKISSRVAIYTTLINPIAKYALMLTPIVDTIENQIPCYCRTRSNSFFVKTMLLSSSVIVALTIPCFGSLMSLVGAFFSVTGSILLPCLCYLKISGAYRKFSFELVVIGFTIVMGFGILVIGTYTSLIQIIQSF